jgi:DHA2 family multidrug resistance protein-like MFS transporter
VSETANELGVALGTAVLGSILVAVYRRQLDEAPAAARDTLGAAHQTAADLGGTAGDTLVKAADQAFVDGMRVASLVTAGLLLGAAVASARVARSD